MNCTFNATPMERLQQHLLFTTNRTDRRFFLRRLHLAQPSHHGHSTILLQSESPSSMCAKLHSNNRDHPTRSLYYSGFPHIFKKSFSILFQYLFNTTLKKFNTIASPHFLKFLIMQLNFTHCINNEELCLQ